MTAGFEELISINEIECDLSRFIALVTKSLIEELDWKLVEQKDVSLRFRIRLSLSSWGEYVEIKFLKDGIYIKSTCRLYGQSFDWGKNKRNVATAKKVVLDSISMDSVFRHCLW